MEGKEYKQEYLLSSVQNAMKILRSFSFEEPEKGIRELAKTLGIGKSTIQRLMSTLASEGFVVKDPDSQKYRLGVSLLSLSSIVTSNLEIHREAIPFLKILVEHLRETAHVGVIDGYEIIYLHKVETNYPIRIFTHVGKYNPAHCTGIGKALLAFRNDNFIDNYIKEKGLQKFTDYTITDPYEFKDHLKLIREQGYAVNDEELGEGIISIAAPIRDYTGDVVSAVNIVGPKVRIKAHNVPTYAKEVIRIANDISENLGYINRY